MHRYASKTTSPRLDANTLRSALAEGNAASGLHPETSAHAFVHDFSRIPFRPKLKVNTPGDAYEREADRVAERITQSPAGQLQRSCACGGSCGDCKPEKDDDGRIQRKTTSEGVHAATEVPGIVEEILRTPGAPLDTATRQFMERHFGHDFTGVRVHTSEPAARSAESIGAQAYTVGRHIVFGSGEYRPGTHQGRRLLAHELTHVAQQGASAPSGDVVKRDDNVPKPPAGTVENPQLGFRSAKNPPHGAALVFMQPEKTSRLRGFVDQFFDEDDLLLASLPPPVDVRNWPADLPRAKRDTAHAIAITKGTPAKGKGKTRTAAVQNTANIPAVEAPKLDAKQKSVVNQIENNRVALPDLLTGTGAAGAAGAGGIGYMYGGKNPGQPTSVKTGTVEKAKLEKWIWEEIGSEGGASSINTYDDMNVTFGKGFARTTLAGVLKTLFDKDAAVKNMFLDAGLALDGTTWLVVNTDLGAIEEGDNALHLLQVDTKLLSLLISMAEDPKYAQTNLDVQWEKVMAAAGKYPDYAASWSENAFKIGFHMAHWLPAYSWTSKDYKPTGGDILKIVKTFAKAMSIAKPNGAYVAPAMWGLLSHLRTFGGGAGLAALTTATGNAVVIEAGKLGTDEQWKGKVLIPDDQSKGTYRVLDATL